MDIETFIGHVRNHKEPDPSWSKALQSLWYAEKPDWDTAHRICQKEKTTLDYWIHANLHREEGDLGNARYWYQRAGRPEHNGTIKEERQEILATALQF